VADARSTLGAQAEDRVTRHLEQHGFQILARNFRTRLGEIDIVAAKGRDLHFVEVRSRTSTRFMRPAESIDARKRARLRRAAELYLARLSGPAPEQVFFDVASVVGDQIELLTGAFE
jgi:putative endonuclease